MDPPPPGNSRLFHFIGILNWNFVVFGRNFLFVALRIHLDASLNWLLISIRLGKGRCWWWNWNIRPRLPLVELGSWCTTKPIKLETTNWPKDALKFDPIITVTGFFFLILLLDRWPPFRFRFLWLPFIHHPSIHITHNHSVPLRGASAYFTTFQSATEKNRIRYLNDQWMKIVAFNALPHSLYHYRGQENRNRHSYPRPHHQHPSVDHDHIVQSSLNKTNPRKLLLFWKTEIR